MEDKRELLTYQVCASTRRIKLDNMLILLGHPSADIKLMAEELYHSVYYEALSEGNYQEEDYVALLIERGLWSLNDDERLNILPNQIEEAKIGIYQSLLKSNDRAEYRKVLTKLKKELYTLRMKRSVLNHITCDGVATLAKTNYLISQSILNKDITITSNLIQSIIEYLSAHKILETQYRDLAQNEPWRSIWSCATDKNPFNKPVCDWSEEQITLCSWSKLYDSIYNHSECPHSSVVEDNDMLDGWLLLQKRKREEELDKKAGDELIPESMKNCGEIFIVAQTVEDAKKIDNLNDSYSKAIKQSRINALKKEGKIEHHKLPDVMQQVSMDYVNLQRERFRR